MNVDFAAWSLPPELYHDDYREGPQMDVDLGPKMANPTRWYRWVVELKMRKNDKEGKQGEYHGTGFFLSLPGATHGGKQVKTILTAGHNLVGADGKMATTIEVTSDVLKKPWVVEKEMFMVCPEYTTTMNQDGSPNDWGVIFIPQDKIHGKDSKQLGFTFSLSFPLQLPLDNSLPKPTCNLGGFTSLSDGQRRPVQSTVGLYPPSKQKVFYQKGGTEAGMSGSPVWVLCNNMLTVIGIHTTGPSDSIRLAQGVRLNLNVLQRIFEWTHTSRRGRLRASGVDQFANEGIYLSFSAPGEFARVRLGSDGLETTFKVLPAGDVQGKPLFAFQLIRPASWSAREERVWVQWDAMRNRVILSSSVGPSSLVALERAPGKKTPGFRVVTLRMRPENRQYYLKMGCDYICEDDRCYGPVESSEVSLVPYATRVGNNFCLESPEDGDM